MKKQDQEVSRAVAQALLEAKKSDLPDPEAGAHVVSQAASRSLRDRMAYLYLAQAVREELRAQAVAAGRRARQRWDAQMKKDVKAADAAYAATMRVGINKILGDHARTLKVEWTQELLHTPFSLGDGSFVAFGEATEDQHQQKVDIYTTNIMGNIESAALHLAAIARLRATGAASLLEAA